jgi:uncharacterized damage-inducible protein DinB
MSNTTLKTLNDYHFQVNTDLLKYLETLEVKNERVWVLMCHMVNAHTIWVNRILKRDNTIGVFQAQTFNDVMSMSELNHQTTNEILENLILEDGIEYTNTQGNRYENSIEQILIHVFNHHTYHRGQINQLLVQEGHKPMVTDFIFYNRTELK